MLDLVTVTLLRGKATMKSNLDSVGRRQFLAVSASAAFWGLPRVLQAAEAQSQGPYGHWPIGVQSYSFRKFDLYEAVKLIQRLGVHYVEFFGAHFPTDSSAEKIAAIQKLLQDAGLSISAHGVDNFGSDHQANRALFEFAKQAGIRNITANPSLDSFDSLDKLVAEYNIRICIHNHGPGALYDGLDSVQQAVEGRHELIGACIDTGHVLRSAEDPIHWIRALGPRVFALHIKDVAELRDKTHNVILGQGHLDVVEMFKALNDVSFPADGSMSLEYEANPDNPFNDMAECLAVLRKAIALI